MDSGLEALPEDVEALKAALLTARMQARDALAQKAVVVAEKDAVTAELAVAKARASEDLALIAHQKLRIAKLERQIYGPRSERSVRLVDQMELQLEEAEAAVTEDEIAAETAVAKTTTVTGFTRRAPAERNTFPEHLPRERVVVHAADGLRLLWRDPAAQTGRGRDPDAGIDPASVEGDRDGPRKVQLPRLREDQPGAGAVPCRSPGVGRVPACWR